MAHEHDSSGDWSWTEAFVGRRFGLAAAGFVLNATPCVAIALSEPMLEDHWVLPMVTAVMLALAVVKVLWPNRLRLSSDGFELIQTLRGRLRVAWKDAEPLFVVTFTGKRGRKYDVVYCKYMSRPSGRHRTLSLPLDLGVSTLSLVIRMNEARGSRWG